MPQKEITYLLRDRSGHLTDMTRTWHEVMAELTELRSQSANQLHWHSAATPPQLASLDSYDWLHLCSGPVLTRSEHGRIQVGLYVQRDEEEEAQWQTDCSEGWDLTGHFTHWRPLPPFCHDTEDAAPAFGLLDGAEVAIMKRHPGGDHFDEVTGAWRSARSEIERLRRQLSDEATWNDAVTAPPPLEEQAFGSWPEFSSGPILVRTRYGKIQVARYEQPDQEDEPRWQTDCSEGWIITGEVTHWKPLPKCHESTGTQNGTML